MLLTQKRYPKKHELAPEYRRVVEDLPSMAKHLSELVRHKLLLGYNCQAPATAAMKGTPV